MSTTVDSRSIVPVGDEDPIVVAAAVLANGLCHHFHNRTAEQLYDDLNRPSAVATHPLLYVLASFKDRGGPVARERRVRSRPGQSGVPEGEVNG